MQLKNDDLTDRTVAIVADLVESLAPREGEPFGHLTPEEARRLVRDLVWLASWIVKARLR